MIRGIAVLLTSVIGTSATAGAEGDHNANSSVEGGNLEIIQSIVPAVLDDANPQPTILPEDLADGYRIQTVDGPVTIKVPLVTGAGESLGRGATAYESDEAGAQTVLLETTSGDVRVLKVISGPEAPTEFEFAVADPSITLAATPTGHVELRRNGLGIATIAPPWAFDSNQRPVATRYTVSGSSFFLEVDHHADGVAYPVVADPIPAVIWVLGAKFVLGAIVSQASKWWYERQGYVCPWWASWWNVWFGCYKRAS